MGRSAAQIAMRPDPRGIRRRGSPWGSADGSYAGVHRRGERRTGYSTIQIAVGRDRWAVGPPTVPWTPTDSPSGDSSLRGSRRTGAGRHAGPPRRRPTGASSGVFFSKPPQASAQASRNAVHRLRETRTPPLGDGGAVLRVQARRQRFQPLGQLLIPATVFKLRSRAVQGLGQVGP